MPDIADTQTLAVLPTIANKLVVIGPTTSTHLAFAFCRALQDNGNAQSTDYNGHISQTEEHERPERSTHDHSCLSISAPDAFPLQNNALDRSKIVLISSHADDVTLQCDAAFVGVSACLPITVTDTVFLECVSQVHAGCSLMSQEVLAQAFLPIGLTPAERDVLKVLAEGKTDLQIADILHKGHQTVRSQVKTIFEKLQVNTRQQAVYRAKLRGLV